MSDETPRLNESLVDLSDPYVSGYRQATPPVAVHIDLGQIRPYKDPTSAWTHQQAVLLDIKTNGPLTYAEIQSMLSNLRGVSHNDVGLIIDQMYRKGEIAYFGGKYCIPEQKVAQEPSGFPLWLITVLAILLLLALGAWLVRS